MWDFFYARRALELGHSIDMINSPFAFPRLPPRANSPLGISNAGRIKDTIVQDKDSMMNRLSSHQAMFQRYATGLFNLSPGPLQPTHPLQKMMNELDGLKEENTKLRNENSALKTGKTKEKKN